MRSLTIIIPVYNAQSYIVNLAKHLNEQTCKDFVAIFIDDASTDDSVKVLHDISEQADFEMVVHQQAKNGGPGKARNDAMEMVQTPFFTFIDADDWVSSNFVEEFLIVAKKYNADIVIGNACKIWSNGKTKTYWDVAKYKDYATANDLACISDYGPCGKLFKTELWDKNTTSFPTTLRSEDLAAIPVLLSKARNFAFAPKVYYFYFQTTESRSRDRGQSYNDIFETCRLLEERINSPYIMEYKYATVVGYGVIMNAILAKKDNKTIEHYIDILKAKYPQGYKHPLIETLPVPKRIFIYLAYLKQIWILRILVKIAK